MHLVCPHCTTSYAITREMLGPGRTVRCSRCKEVWLARPEDAVDVPALQPAMAAASRTAGNSDAGAEWQAMAREQETHRAPVVDSPSISPSGDETSGEEADWPAAARDDAEAEELAFTSSRRRWLPGLSELPPFPRPRNIPAATLPTACAAMGALALALIIWRVDVVRLLPQTASFYRMAGLEVNLRGLAFKDVRITNDSIDGKPVLVIEGMIVGETRKPVELPRLRFSVRDAQGAEIYAWNAVLEQTVLKPGERALFKSRLASPPPEGRNIDVRFFNKRDLAAGRA